MPATAFTETGVSVMIPWLNTISRQIAKTYRIAIGIACALEDDFWSVTEARLRMPRAELQKEKGEQLLFT